MQQVKDIWTDPKSYVTVHQPDAPVMFFSAETLQDTAHRFLRGFPGLVTYAVKANADPMVLDNLAAAGISAFDVASPAEIALLRRAAPQAALHYNNPVRSPHEIRAAVAAGVASYSVDSQGELTKLIDLVPAEGTEIAVRLRLPVKGAAYDFGSKFGADPELAAALLARVAKAGFIPAMTFHPGTQCTDPEAWAVYIDAAAETARRAGVRLARLNVGGGFPSHRAGPESPSLEAIFKTIGTATRRAFGDVAPALVCEPGRAMVAEAFSLVVRVRARRDDGAIFLNDGIYGALSEFQIMGATDRVAAFAPDGTPRRGAPQPFIVFGPTCDSFDRLPDGTRLPADLAEEDYLLFSGAGAYSLALTTAFNGYGTRDVVTVRRLVT